MRKRRDFWLLINLLLLGALLLTACGGSEEAADDSIKATATTQAVVDATPDKKSTTDDNAVPEEDAVTLTIWSEPNRAEVIRAFAPDFEADFGVKLVVQEFGFFDLLTNFSVAAPAGKGPDIVDGAHDWLGELATNGLLAPLDLGDKGADFASAALQAFTYDGELYGLPYMTENVALFRNTDLVPDAPATWKEVVEISRELTADNSDDIEANQYGFVLSGNDAYHFFPMMTAYGGYVFGQNADGTYDPTDIGIGNAGSIKAAALFDSMLEEGLIPPSLDVQTIIDWFEQGKAAMTITGPWNLPRVQDSGINYAIDPLPEGSAQGRPFMGSKGFMVNAFSENPLLAQIFVAEFIATPELMQAFFDVEPRPPAYLPILNNLDDADVQAFALAGENALPMPAIPEMGSVWQAWSNALLLVAQQTEDPDSAFPTAADQIAMAISGESAAEDASSDEPVAYDMVNIPGTAQTAIGCSGDWLPNCEESALTLGDDGLWSGTFDIPSGEYEVKVAINGGWDINFGVDGQHNGANIAFTLEADTSVTFAFDPQTSLLEIAGDGIEVTGGATFGAVEEEEEEPAVSYDMVNIPGTAQTAIGCSGDWLPDCEESALTLGDDGLWSGTFDLPAGEYEGKVAINGGWDINFGVDGEHNGANIAFTLEADTSVTFTFDPQTSLLDISGDGIEVTGGATFGAVEEEEEEPAVSYDMVNIPGTAQTAIGCSGDWLPDCEESALTLGDDGLWSGTFDIPAGEYELKVAIDGGWDINFGVDGEPGGANILFTLDADSSVTFTFDPTTNLLEITSE